MKRPDASTDGPAFCVDGIWVPMAVCRLLTWNAGSWPNGIKLTSTILLYQLLTQCLPGFDHEREALRAPLLDAWLHPLWANGVDDQSP
jgi:hypothetical protein